MTWVADRLSDLFTLLQQHVKIGPAGASAIGTAVVVLCVLGVAAIGAHLLLQFEFARTRQAGAVALAPVRSAHALAALAGRSALAGDYARAIRILFLAAVTLLDLRGVVRDERSATINELRRALCARDERLEPAFVAIAHVYTSAAYAESPVGETAWNSARAAYDDLVSMAAS
jgi:uncharacterized MAPEG superfamily protein